MFYLFLPFRSLLRLVTHSWAGKTLTRCWCSISVRILARGTSWMWRLSPGLWSDSTRSAKNWRNWWAPTPLTCRWTSSASWTTSMSLERWTGTQNVSLAFLLSPKMGKNPHLFSFRGQFEEMCADILTRVEPPLQSLLEQASEYFWRRGLKRLTLFNC